jgi:hypothetical protein
MFEVTKFEPPQIFVTCRRTGETYMFAIGNDGALERENASFDQADARRAAIAYLAWFSQARERLADRYSAAGGGLFRGKSPTPYVA